MSLHGRPAVIMQDLVITVGAQTGIAFRGYTADQHRPVDLAGATATLTVTTLDRKLVATATGTVQNNIAAFYLTVDDTAPDVGEYRVQLDPNPFSQPRFAQGSVRFDRTGVPDA